jgi:hypothetical protein
MVVKVTVSMLKLIALILVATILVVVGQPLWAAPSAARGACHGYDREVIRMPHLSGAVGGQLTWYGIPADLKPAYHAHPIGVVLFLRLRAL